MYLDTLTILWEEWGERRQTRLVVLLLVLYLEEYAEAVEFVGCEGHFIIVDIS